MLYRLYSIFIGTPLLILATFMVGVSVSIASIFGTENKVAHYYAPMIWGKVCCAVFFLDVKVEGLERLDPRQSYVFLANHQGYFDILLLYGYLDRPFKWMMKEYLKKMPIIGLACMCSRQIFVGDSISSIQKAVADARKTLKGGMSMSIFPEGTRTYDGRLSPFKRGAFMLANEIGLPLVPITINGSYRALNRKSFIVSRSKLSLTIHEPITAADREGKTTKVVMQEVYDIINKDLIVE